MATANFTPSRSRVQAVMIKIEATYGTDPVPVGSADGILLYGNGEVIFNLDAAAIELRPYSDSTFTRTTKFITQRFGRVRFKTYMQGSGTRGDNTIAGYKALDAALQGCAFKSTATASTSIVYQQQPISTLKSVTIYCRAGGYVHKVTGAVGDVTMSGNAKDGWMLDFDFRGLYVEPVAVASLFSGWTGGTKRALPFLGIGCTINNGASFVPVVKSFTYRQGVTIEVVDNCQDATGVEMLMITDRNPSLTMVVAKDDYASANITYIEWFQDLFSSGPTTHAVAWTVTGSAGNIVAASFPKAQVIEGMNPTAANGHLDVTVPYLPTETTADLEAVFTVT